MSKSKLVGTWKLDSSDANWDEYMKTVGKLMIFGFWDEGPEFCHKDSSMCLFFM